MHAKLWVDDREIIHAHFACAGGMSFQGIHADGFCFNYSTYRSNSVRYKVSLYLFTSLKHI